MNDRCGLIDNSGVKINEEMGGPTPLEQWSTPLEKCQNGAGGSLGQFTAK